MSNYVPQTPEQISEMLGTMGLSSLDELYSGISDEMKIDHLDLPEGKSILEVERAMDALARKNTVFSSIFRGAGAYNHYIPPLARTVIEKESILTAYTPYQAEVSQGVLQNIFEFQTIICRLTGMDVANASMYDAASSLAEAVRMCADKKRKKVLIADTVNPRYVETVRTYAHPVGYDIQILPAAEDGTVDQEALKAALDDPTVASVVVQQPNFYGVIEDTRAIGDIVKPTKASFIMCADPLALALLATPAESQADVAVGEVQPFGLPLSFGGPYVGYFATTEKLMRKMPGRIVGQTKDRDGKRSFVLTLQAREQHIRREKATSNICTTEALCAEAVSVYTASMGPRGIHDAAYQSHAKAEYLKKQLLSIDGIDAVHSAPTAFEFVTTLPVEGKALESELAKKGILSGLPLDDGTMLWCATEMNTKEDIDALVAAVREAVEA
ncbi:MAG: aminomethyl-transferring glycine dehydrogenase subunit GcvPA [Actinomycetaceae bacterium]|nr:aminomethyl-transferring glycine dehydrogenase subunit GcvPA [Actinomycetaceae bacterium]MDY6082737.1 aminomethyl-transferring glycine dehydrogenase subunit GcvPA [Actinomycetaceae bacterium]